MYIKSCTLNILVLCLLYLKSRKNTYIHTQKKIGSIKYYVSTHKPNLILVLFESHSIQTTIIQQYSILVENRWLKLDNPQ